MKIIAIIFLIASSNLYSQYIGYNVEIPDTITYTINSDVSDFPDFIILDSTGKTFIYESRFLPVFGGKQFHFIEADNYYRITKVISDDKIKSFAQKFQIRNNGVKLEKEIEIELISSDTDVVFRGDSIKVKYPNHLYIIDKKTLEYITKEPNPKGK